MTRKKHIPQPTMFGKNMRKLRNLKGIGQSALANQVGLTRQKIASYEAGLVEPNAKVFLSVCTYFGIDPVKMLVEDFTPEQTRLSSSSPAHPSADTHTISKGIDSRVNHSNLDRLSTAKSHLQNATEEFDKILEGYDMFKSIQKDIDHSEDGQAFSVMYEDLLTIMRLLSENNHDFLKEDLP